MVMGKLARQALPPDLYERDFVSWTEAQARLLRAHSVGELDWLNLAEEIASLGISDKRAIGSHLEVILTHLLKWRFQPEQRLPGWLNSIEEARDQIERIVENSPSLKSLPASIIGREYVRARRKAARQTGFPPKSFPASCPFDVADVLAPDWLPGD
jgi:hypothetical protein